MRSRAILGLAPGREPMSRRMGTFRPPDASRCMSTFAPLDPNHPVVIIEAPRGPGPTPQSATSPLTLRAVKPYAAACDVHGVDIYPVSVPPGAHAGRAPVNTDISVVGDVTTIIAQATQRKAIWTTLQIAWSGVFPPHPSSSRPCNRLGSWPTTRSWPARADSCFLAASSRRS